MSGDSVAVVESTFQLWMLHEAVAAGLLDRPTRVFARGSVVDPARQLPGIDPVIAGSIASGLPVREICRSVRRFDHVVVGDAFSKLVGAVIGLGPRRATILDDGAASIRLSSLLATPGAALVRARGGTPSDRMAGRVGRWSLDRLSRRGAVDWITGFDSSIVAEGGPGTPVVRRHRWPWIASVAPGFTPLDASVVVLGSAMVTDGLVQADWYERWLRQVVEPGSHFVPHRRERVDHVDLARRLGGSVGRLDIPIEFPLAATADAIDIRLLPSTPALTLPHVAGRHPLSVTLPDPDAWTPGSPTTMRALAAQIVVRRPPFDEGSL